MSKIAGVGLAALLAATSAHGRGVVVDDGLVPSLLRFNLETTPGSLCDASLCKFVLPYALEFGPITTNEVFLYRSGIVSFGAPLPAAAFTSTPTNGVGDPISIPEFFAASNYNIIAAGYRPDNAGTPASLSNGLSGLVTSNTIRQFALGGIQSCTPAPAPDGFTVCPAGFDPDDPNADSDLFIDAFITANGLDLFEGDINLRVGLQYVVIHKPVGGFANVELFQDDNFGEEEDPVFVGLKNNLKLFDLEVAKDTAFDYRFAVAAGVPEPASWAMMIAGFGLAGIAARRRVRMTIAERSA